MSEIQRICTQCGQSGAFDTRYCPHCGYDAQVGLPTPRTNLPVTVAKAALPILAGVAGLAVRAGWRLLQNRLAHAAVQTGVDNTVTVPRPTPAAPPAPQQGPRRTIHIRSSWAMGDANGVWRQGTSDHTIEIND